MCEMQKFFYFEIVGETSFQKTVDGSLESPHPLPDWIYEHRVAPLAS